MNYKSKQFYIVLALLLLPAFSLAQEFEPLVGIPGVTSREDQTFGGYMNALYALSISLAGLLAVVKIVIAGAKYMLSDIVTSKEDAKKDIKGALFGLLIVIAAALILYVINPRLLDTSITLNPEGVTTGTQSQNQNIVSEARTDCQSTTGCNTTVCRSTGADGGGDICTNEKAVCESHNSSEGVIEQEGSNKVVYCFPQGR